MFDFTFLLVNFGKCCIHLWMSSNKSEMLHLEKNIFQKYWLFCYRFIAFTLDLCSLLSVSLNHYLKHAFYSVDQSALLTGFRTDFMLPVRNFCHWVIEVPPCQTSSAATSKEKRLFSQATGKLYQSYNLDLNKVLIMKTYKKKRWENWWKLLFLGIQTGDK